MYLSPIDFTGFDDDELSQPLMFTLWAQELQMGRTLLDGKLRIALINKKLVNKMTLRPPIYRDNRVKISFTNNANITLSKFVKIPVNVQGVETVIQAWLVDMKVYDLLLGVS